MNKVRILSNIHIHPLFWVIVVIAVIHAQFFNLLLLFLIVFIHELGHLVACLYFSWDVKRVLLLPFGGVVETDEHGRRPLKEEMIVILAGPLQHFWLIALAKILFLFSFISPATYETFVQFNWMILFFNCLPILPLDGGKLLYYIFSSLWPFRVALERAIYTSTVFLMLFTIAILLIFPTHLNGWLMVFFLAYSLMQEWKNRHYTFMRFLLERYDEVPQVMRKRRVVVHENDSILDVVQKFYRGFLHSVVVVDKGTNIGIISERACIEAFFQGTTPPPKIKNLLS